MITLTTIGLGDFVPATKSGVYFNIFYCIFGLGLIGLLITAISDQMAALKEDLEEAIDDALSSSDNEEETHEGKCEEETVRP